MNKPTKKNILLLIALVIGIFIWLGISLVYAAISCTVTNNTACAKTYVLYVQNDTGGWSNAHSQNVSVNSYAYGICCNADGDGQTVTTTCSSTAPAFLKLSNLSNAHVEIPSLSNYAYSACIGVTNRNVTCTNSTGSCSAGYGCIASIASSESADSNLTNAHIDANCSSTYPMKICCGYNNRPPIVSNVQLVSTSGNNYSSDNLSVTFTATDADNDAIYNTSDWRRNGQSIAVLNMPFNTNFTSTSNATRGVIDYSTNKINGSLGNSTAGTQPTWTSDGKIGGAYSFDGGDYLSIPNSAALNPSSSNFTISLWFKMITAGGANSAILYNKENLYEASGGGGYFTYAWQPNWAWNGGTSFPVNVGEWYHAVIVYNGIDQMVYKNGTLVYNRSQTGVMGTNTNELRLGARGAPGSPTSFANAVIDEVQIFNRSLSSDQIQAIYQAGLNNHSVDIIVRNETSVGENWTSCVTASDGKDDSTTVCSNNVTIKSAVPTMTSSIIYPQPAYVNESLRGYCNATDIDDATLYYHYSWFLNNVFNSSGNFGPYSQGVQVNIANITNSSLIIGQNWTLQCVADDLTSNSTALNSSVTTIVARTPETVILKNPTNGNTTVHDRKPLFEWYATNVTIYYTINITSSTGCGGNYFENVTGSLNFTPTNELCVDTEGPNTYYKWQVKACSDDICGNWSALWNFSIEPYVVITLVNNSINFSSMTLGQTKNTTTGTVGPYVIQNDGNVVADMINITASNSLWASVGLGTEYFQMKARVSNESGSFNITGSITTWSNVTTANQTMIRHLNYSNMNDSAYLDIQIKVPGDEPPGVKQTNVIFYWEQTP